MDHAVYVGELVIGEFAQRANTGRLIDRLRYRTPRPRRAPRR
jgi:hypothetical protein